nr:hypothetical protein [uncultured Flavobacterium sp.]
MKKKISVLLFSIALFSCNNKEQEISPLDKLLSNFFINQNVDYKANNIALKEVQNKFKPYADSIISEQLYNELNYKILTIHNTKKDSVLVQFYSSGIRYNYGRQSINIEFFVNMPYEKVLNLDVKKEYKGKFNIIKKLTEREIFSQTSLINHYPEYSFKTGGLPDLDINLGVYQATVSDLKE